MTDQVLQRPAVKVRRRDPVRDGLIVLCITVVALALGIGLHLQFALAFWLAVVAALAVYVALLSTHALVRRSERVDELRREVARLEAKLGRPVARSEATSPRPAPTPRVVQPPVVPATQPPAVTASGADAVMGDYWNFSPSNAATLQAGRSTTVATAAPLAPATVSAPNARAQSPAAQREAEADQINAVIKKLAADITQGQAALARDAAPASVAAHATPLPDIDDSVAALHAAADAMREAGKVFDDLRADPHTSTPVRSAPPPLPRSGQQATLPAADPARERLASVAEALEREQFDVMLQPILGLSDRRAQHYLVSVRLRGGIAGPGSRREAQYAPGSGLLPLLDAVKVESAARVAWRMEDRAKPGALFSQLSGESLVSDRFLNRFADTYRQGDTLSGRLVMSFKQGEVRKFSELQWATLRDMADLGFRFCIEDITDLDMDFAALGSAGFTFARLDAPVFLEGLMAEGGVIPAADLCRYFASLSLAVIVGEIDDDAVSAQLQAYGVQLGHGDLFGGARPVKADVLRNPHAAVA